MYRTDNVTPSLVRMCTHSIQAFEALGRDGLCYNSIGNLQILKEPDQEKNGTDEAKKNRIGKRKTRTGTNTKLQKQHRTSNCIIKTNAIVQ